VWWHDAVDGQSADCPPEPMDARTSCHPLHVGHDREAEGHHAHDRGIPDPGRVHAQVRVRPAPDTDVYWCTADCGWVTGHSYIVYGPLANRRPACMYEGTPDHPARTGSGIVEKYKITILYTAPTANPDVHEVGHRVPRVARSLDAAACSVRSASRSTPRPGSGTERTSAAALPRRRHVVADRDRRDHDQPAARRHGCEARQRDVPAARHRASTSSNDDGQAVGIPGGGYLVLNATVAVDAARDLG
jgi:hypothetical protein